MNWLNNSAGRVQHLQAQLFPVCTISFQDGTFLINKLSFLANISRTFAINPKKIKKANVQSLKKYKQGKCGSLK